MIIQWLYEKLHPSAPTEVVSTEKTKQEAIAEAHSAEIELQQVLERGQQVQHLVSRLRDQDERNHFGPLVESTMRGNG